ncbi:quinone oxidoreductase family protein [Larsenimonas suaedae]|uniref:Quinone oxidoreductase n=1 Tax=Larsenimonas suaedae TaxID=1851019 RepID=A0ABU1GTA9_9GAMM|nr:quinone oxidoreductase [Larsenimonas suaedae]MCM2971694.1 quinone oxidoreductase [Larsenimonas suaedae]MDR5895246.1 quinone oxidoreductase [Larsenimonas suaedae]
MTHGIRFSQHGGSEVLEYVEVPTPTPSANEVLVRNQAIGMNFIDIYGREGLYPVSSFPSGLGTEAAGIIEAVGEDVQAFSPGDRVAYAQGPLGAYSQLHCLPAEFLIPLPESISFDVAAASLLKGMTVQYLLRQVHEVKAGDTILFHAAAGGVGTLACQWANALGARLIGTVSTDEKAELARSLGADAIINYTTEDVVERVKALTDNELCDVVYDSVGKDTWPVSLDCVKRRGLIVSFGNASGPVEGVNLGILNQKGSLFVTRPSLGGYADTPSRRKAMAAELFDMIERGAIDVQINQRFALSEAGKAQDALMQRRTTGATLLIP